MFTYKAVYNRRNRLDKNGKAPIDIRVTLNRIPHFIGTGYTIYPEHWDPKTQRVKNKHPHWIDINNKVKDYLARIEKYAFDRDRDGEPADIEEIKFIIKPKKRDDESFLEFAQAKVQNREDIKEDTRKDHENQLNKLHDFFPAGIRFADMNFSWLEELEAKMLRKNYKPGTRWKYHKVIRTYLSFARKQGLIDRDPYEDFQVVKPEGSRKALSFDELKSLEQLDREKLKPLERVTLDKFLFACYTGIRISDMELLSSDSIVSERKGQYLVFTPQKGKMINAAKPISIPLHNLFNGAALEISRKYNTQNNLEVRRLFPYLDQNLINAHLKTIGKLAGIKWPLSFHVARHTFGSSLAELTGDVILINKLMGHSKIETSMVYIHMSKNRIDKKIDRLSFDY